MASPVHISSLFPQFVPPADPVPPALRIEFFIHGTPKPGGSKKAFAIMRHGKIMTRPNGSPIINIVDMANNKSWKQSCAAYARRAYQGPPLIGPLKIQCEFNLVRPKFHYGSGRNAQLIKEGAPEFPAVMPDATKLFRSTEDALTGVLWQDDAQIVLQVISKVYGAMPGARIVLSQA